MLVVDSQRPVWKPVTTAGFMHNVLMKIDDDKDIVRIQGIDNLANQAEILVSFW
jgi:hypothetical protein